ncbi:Nucleoporin nup49/NSP49 (Nuclear pore protein nup49/NSP49) [Savitreella phatthalungensis]
MFSFGASVAPTQAPASTLAPAPTLERLTRVSDLPPDAQALLEGLQAHISQQTSLSDQLGLHADILQDTVDSIDADVGEVQRRLARVRGNLQNDQTIVQTIADELAKTSSNARLSTTYIDSARSRTFHGRPAADVILSFFNKSTDALERRLKEYIRLLDNLERHVDLLDDGSVTAKGLKQALEHEQLAFMSLSNRVASLHDIVARRP